MLNHGNHERVEAACAVPARNPTSSYLLRDVVHSRTFCGTGRLIAADLISWGSAQLLAGPHTYRLRPTAGFPQPSSTRLRHSEAIVFVGADWARRWFRLGPTIIAVPSAAFAYMEGIGGRSPRGTSGAASATPIFQSFVPTKGRQ